MDIRVAGGEKILRFIKFKLNQGVGNLGFSFHFCLA